MTTLYVVVVTHDQDLAPDVMVFEWKEKAERAMKECIEEYPNATVHVRPVTLNEWTCGQKR